MTSLGALHVLTVHFNTPELTSQLVRTLPQKTPRGRPIYIHVLDNCSDPENLRQLQENVAGQPGVTLQLSDTNVGFGAGMNLIAEHDEIADSDLLWFLNSDIRLDADCLKHLEEEIDAGQFVVISPLIHSTDVTGPSIWYCGGSIDASALRVTHDLYGCDVDDAPRHPFETDFITGAAPMMRASTFRAVGGFPRGYFIYWEDTLLSWKVRHMGMRLGVVPAARLWHAVGASSGYGQSPTFYYWSARNRFIFASDIGISRSRLIRGRAGIETLRIIARAAIRESEGRARKVRAAVEGTLHGLTRANRRS